MSNLFLAQDLRVILNKFTMELLWGFVVGLIFSTVGAAGGILAGVGHLSIFGIRDANLVKFYNQFLVALSPHNISTTLSKTEKGGFLAGLLVGSW